MMFDELLAKRPDASTLSAWLLKIPYAHSLGMQAEIVADDILFRLPENPDLVGNPMVPALHGGVVGGFMEQCASLYLIARMEQPVVPKIINFSLDYLRACRLRDTYARCVVTRQGRQVANVAVSAWQEDESTPCTIGRAHFLIPGTE